MAAAFLLGQRCVTLSRGGALCWAARRGMLASMIGSRPTTDLGHVAFVAHKLTELVCEFQFRCGYAVSQGDPHAPDGRHWSSVVFNECQNYAR